MKKTIQLAMVLFALVFFSVNSFAFIRGVQDQITVPNSNFDFTFTATNNDSVPRNLELEVFLPFDYVFLDKPGVIAAGETATVRLKVFPQKTAQDSTFSGKIIAHLGLETSEKTFRINVYNYTVCPVNITVSGPEEKTADGKTNFMVFSRAENTANSSVDFSIKEFSGIPGDWATETDNSVLINAFETRVFRTTILPGSSFHGQMKIVYLCNGEEVSRTQDINFDRQDFLSSGLAGLSGSLGSLPGGEFLLNIVLVLAASLLMVMFIARLVRVVVEKSESPVQLASQRNQYEGDSTIAFAQKPDRKLEELKDLVAKERETRRK